ncbi:hypothetical protein IG631_10866 [Alternaria alternata]|nr:hypothetical protein IG631_10866 [Alternaria alternata]
MNYPDMCNGPPPQGTSKAFKSLSLCCFLSSVEWSFSSAKREQYENHFRR